MWLPRMAWCGVGWQQSEDRLERRSTVGWVVGQKPPVNRKLQMINGADSSALY